MSMRRSVLPFLVFVLAHVVITVSVFIFWSNWLVTPRLLLLSLPLGAAISGSGRWHCGSAAWR